MKVKDLVSCLSSSDEFDYKILQNKSNEDLTGYISIEELSITPYMYADVCFYSVDTWNHRFTFRIWIYD